MFKPSQLTPPPIGQTRKRLPETHSEYLHEPPYQEHCNSAAQKENLLREMAPSLLDSDSGE